MHATQREPTQVPQDLYSRAPGGLLKIVRSLLSTTNRAAHLSQTLLLLGLDVLHLETPNAKLSLSNLQLSLQALRLKGLVGGVDSVGNLGGCADRARRHGVGGRGVEGLAVAVAGGVVAIGLDGAAGTLQGMTAVVGSRALRGVLVLAALGLLLADVAAVLGATEAALGSICAILAVLRLCG